MRQLLTDENESLIALFAKSETKVDGCSVGYLTPFYVPKLHALLNVLEELGNDDAAGARQSGVMDKETAAADKEDHAVRKWRGFSADDASLRTCEMEITSLFVIELPSLSEPQLHSSDVGEACPVDPRAIDGFAHCAAREAIGKIERHHELIIDSWRGD